MADIPDACVFENVVETNAKNRGIYLKFADRQTHIQLLVEQNVAVRTGTAKGFWKRKRGTFEMFSRNSVTRCCFPISDWSLRWQSHYAMRGVYEVLEKVIDSCIRTFAVHSRRCETCERRQNTSLSQCY